MTPTSSKHTDLKTAFELCNNVSIASKSDGKKSELLKDFLTPRPQDNKVKDSNKRVERVASSRRLRFAFTRNLSSPGNLFPHGSKGEQPDTPFKRVKSRGRLVEKLNRFRSNSLDEIEARKRRPRIPQMKSLLSETADPVMVIRNRLFSFRHLFNPLGIRRIESEKYIFCFEKVTLVESFFLKCMSSIQGGDRDGFFERFIRVIPEGDKYESVAREIIKIFDDSIAQNGTGMDVWDFIKEHHKAELRRTLARETDFETIGSLLRGTSVASEIMKIQFLPLLTNVLEESTKRSMKYLSETTLYVPVVLRENQLIDLDQEMIAEKYGEPNFKDCKDKFFEDNRDDLKIALNFVLKDTRKASKQIPEKIKDVYRDHVNNCRMFFPELKSIVHQQIEGMFILRFLIPYLISDPQIKKFSDNDDHQSRLKRAMISLSRLIQWTTAVEVTEDYAKLPPLVKPLFQGKKYAKRKSCVNQIVFRIFEFQT